MTEKDHNKFWELAAAKMHNEASEEEVQELEQLLENQNDQKQYKKLEQLKDNVAGLKSLSGLSQRKSWNKVASQVERRTIHIFWKVAQYAAIIVFAFLLGNILTNPWNKQNEVSGFAEVKVPLGQMSELTFYDGTKVWLNSGTTLRYKNDFGKKDRNVSVQGEAFFDVTKSKTPFKVEFKGKEVEVLGTRFNVVAYDDEDISRVTLVEGKVNINAPNGATVATLTPAQQITIDEVTNKSNISKVETNFYVSWTEGKIVFDEEKLSDISQRLERWYNVDIQFENETIENLKFSGTILKNKPFDQIVKAFGLLLPVEIEYTHVLGEQDKVMIKQKKMPM